MMADMRGSNAAWSSFMLVKTTFSYLARFYAIIWLLVLAFVVSRFWIWYRLRAFKGPWLGSISPFWMAKAAHSGRMNHELTAINEKYGRKAPTIS